MTALPDWDTAGPTDAELATAAAAGDRGAFARIYDRYADRLHDFCAGMLRDRDAAADCVQDTFCTAATRLPQLREPDKLRPWLYAIARNEALRLIRNRRREQLSEDIPEMASGEPGPDTLAARTELADLVAEAAGGLSDRDRAVLELTYRHGLDGPELAEALGVSPVNANKMVQRLRDTIERSLGALLVARRARHNPNGCPELAAVLAGWDGTFSILMRKRIARHIETCPTCEQDRAQMVTPAALMAGAPMLIPAPTWLRAQTLTHARLVIPTTPSGATGQFTTGSTQNQPDSPPAHPPSTSAPTGSAGSGQVTADPPYPETVTGPSAKAPRDSRRAPGEHPANVNRDRVEHTDIADHHVNGAPRGRRRRLMLLAGLIAATLMTSLGLTIVWLYHPNTPVGPAGLTGTAPSTVTSTPAAPLTTTTAPNTPLPPPVLSTDTTAASTTALSSSQAPPPPPPTFSTTTTGAPIVYPPSIQSPAPTTVYNPSYPVTAPPPVFPTPPSPTKPPTSTPTSSAPPRPIAPTRRPPFPRPPVTTAPPIIE
jgi:RNA polymerase sigma factor (sigma-70 family)